MQVKYNNKKGNKQFLQPLRTESMTPTYICLG